MAFGGPRSSCVRPGAHSARHQGSRDDWTPCRMAGPFVSAGAHAPHSNETPDPTPTRGASHSARRLRSLVFLCSSAVKTLGDCQKRRGNRRLVDYITVGATQTTDEKTTKITSVPHYDRQFRVTHLELCRLPT